MLISSACNVNFKPVGIITMFYNSSNYGGILQAYALVKLLNKHGIIAEQIRYDNYSAFSFERRMKRKLYKYINNLKTIKNLKEIWYIYKREKLVKKASEDLVPHSKKVFTEKSIKKCLVNYSAFITGSDQVWHGEWPAYFLSFVPKGYLKIAYAVSTGKTKLSDIDYEKIQKYILDFTSVSVRERITQKTLMELFPELKVQLTLDPTLLLEDSDWNAIVSSKKIKSNYLFCYFLGNNEEYRNLAKEYASKKGLVLATIPHMQGRVEEADLGYGDIKLYDVTPQDFLSYVKNADVIFTDSFHACVFCQIFKKQFFVFGRSDRKEMNNRIENLTQLFNAEERFIVENTKIDINYIEKLNCIEYSYENLQDYEKLKQDSIHFLMDSITNS